MRIYTVINQKGGVGKSTTANALGAALHHQGRRVLYVDLDAQGNLSYSMNATGRPLSSLEVLTGTATAEEAIIHTPQGDLIPASPALAGADAVITETGKEYRLREALEPLKGDYDFVIIDTPPALGVLTVNALAACNRAIVPAQADIYSLQGIGQLIQTVTAVKKYCNPVLTIDGILLTRYSTRAVVSRDMAGMLQDTADQLGTILYTARIRECVALKEAQVQRQDIFTYAPHSNAAADYAAFAEEVLKAGAEN